MKPRRITFIPVAVLVLLALTQSTGAPSVNAHAAWQHALKGLPTPSAGCFEAAYPRVAWTRVACGTAPALPYVPKHGHRPFVVGGSNDFAGRVTGNLLSTEGSFDSVSGVTSETGQVGGTGGQVADTYSLQINTAPFTTTVCGGKAGCQGWQQFVYSSSSQMIYIQYWLLRFNATCPSGWFTFQFPGNTDIYCFRNSGSATVAKQLITNLANLRLVGRANASGNDTVEMFVGGTSAGAVSAAGTMLNLGPAWNDGEFIIVGDCCGSQANFNAGSTIVVRTTVHNGTTSAPTCMREGFTGETNNLDLVGTAAVGTGPAPAVVSRQSNTLTAMASCQAADGTGDTHLTTFKGLLYDFQAAGDFIYAQTGKRFVVQTRQVSGAPTWPDASVNSAVGAQIGKTRVALCLPRRLELNGRARSLSSGGRLILPNDIDVSRAGDVYVIRGTDGQSVRAVLHDKWIDVSVGLGQSPQNVVGLLANAKSVRQVATRGGAVLTWPLPFETIYGRYGNSWRLKPSASILCKQKRVERSNPARPFYAKNLEPEVARRARAICLKFGIRNKALLEACTLDVAVTGRAEAARVYRGARAPVAVGRPR